jgi:hypothetical protein
LTSRQILNRGAQIGCTPTPSRQLRDEHQVYLPFPGEIQHLLAFSPVIFCPACCFFDDSDNFETAGGLATIRAYVQLSINAIISIMTIVGRPLYSVPPQNYRRIAVSRNRLQRWTVRTVGF